MKRIVVLGGFLVLLASWAQPVHAQWAVSRYSVSAAGIPSSGGSYRLVATLGQPVIGTQGRVQAGLWPGSRGVVTSVEPPGPPAGVPQTFRVHGNYPNPFNPTTAVRFDLPERAEVRLSVFDVLGRQVLAFPAQPFAAGNGHTLRIDGAELSSGMYIYHITATSNAATSVASGRMLLVK